MHCPLLRLAAVRQTLDAGQTIRRAQGSSVRVTAPVSVHAASAAGHKTHGYRLPSCPRPQPVPKGCPVNDL
ncbi:hypothetical protein GCM10009647_053760 [Streptomyces sanglieri]